MYLPGFVKQFESSLNCKNNFQKKVVALIQCLCQTLSFEKLFGCQCNAYKVSDNNSCCQFYLKLKYCISEKRMELYDADIHTAAYLATIELFYKVWEHFYEL